MAPIAIQLIILLSCIAGIIRPIWGLCGYLFLVFLQPDWIWRFEGLYGLAYQKNIMICVLIGSIFPLLNGIQLRWAKGVLFCAVAFISLSVLSGFGSQAPVFSARYLDVTWKAILVMALIILNTDTVNKTLYILTAVMAGSAYNAFRLNEDYFQVGWCRWLNDAWGYKGDSNVLCLFSVFPIVASVGLVFTAQSKLLRAIAAFSLLVHVHMVFILASRGAMIGLVVGALFAIYYMPKTKLAIISLLILVIAVSTLAGPSVVEEFLSAFNKAEDQDASANSRFILWKTALVIANDFPLLGVGPGATQFLIPSYESTYSGMQAKHPHNVFLEVLSGVGYPACVCFLFIHLYPWYRSFKIIRMRDARLKNQNLLVSLPIAVGIPVFCVTGMFCGSGIVESNYYLIGTAIGGMLAFERSYLEAQKDRADFEIEDEELQIDEFDSELFEAKRSPVPS